MKFTFILIGVMLLRGIELHRHMNQHSHKRHKTDPQNEINYETHLKAGNALNGRLSGKLKSVDKALKDSNLWTQHRHKKMLGPTLVVRLRLKMCLK